MGTFEADSESISALATSIEAILPRVPGPTIGDLESSPHVFHHDALATAASAFRTRWAKGAPQLARAAKSLAELLRSSAAEYERTEKTVTDASAKMSQRAF